MQWRVMDLTDDEVKRIKAMKHNDIRQCHGRSLRRAFSAWLAYRCFRRGARGLKDAGVRCETRRADNAFSGGVDDVWSGRARATPLRATNPKCS
jgi:hypothetical protein